VPDNLSIIIPVFQAQDCIEELAVRLRRVLEGMELSDWQVVFVDDCSRDQSWQKLQMFCGGDSRMFAVRLTKNVGKFRAILVGLNYIATASRRYGNVQHDYVLFMDCDLQHAPENIPALFAVAGPDRVVLGVRRNRVDHLSKRAMSKLYYRVFNFISGCAVSDRATDFCIVPRFYIRFLGDWTHSRHLAIAMQLVPAALHEVEIEHCARFAGRSAFTFYRLLRLGVDNLRSYLTAGRRSIIAVATALLTAGMFYRFGDVAGGLFIVVGLLFAFAMLYDRDRSISPEHVIGEEFRGGDTRT